MDANWKTPIPATCPFDGHLLHTAVDGDAPWRGGITTTCPHCKALMHFDADAALIPLDDTGEADAICQTFIAVEGVDPDDDFDWANYVATLHKAGFYIARRPHAARTATSTDTVKT